MIAAAASQSLESSISYVIIAVAVAATFKYIYHESGSMLSGLKTLPSLILLPIFSDKEIEAKKHCPCAKHIGH